MVVVFTTTVQSVPITTNVVSPNSAHGEVYSIQLYVVKFVNDLLQISGFLRESDFDLDNRYGISVSQITMVSSFCRNHNPVIFSFMIYHWISSNVL
jgi:hypothetical protein